MYLQRQKLYQFLMGLNDNYGQARSQILMMTPLPSLNQAYALIISDESQKSMASSTSAGLLGAVPVSNGYDPTAMYSKEGNQKYKKNFNLFCEFCKMKGHTKDICYKLVGFPTDSRFKKKGQ